MQRNARSLLIRARSAEAGGNLREAEESLSLYLALHGDDSTAWSELAESPMNAPRTRASGSGFS